VPKQPAGDVCAAVSAWDFTVHQGTIRGHHMLKMEADYLKLNPPRLGKGEVMPIKPSYWLIWVLDDTGKPYNSRCCWDKVMTPVEASQKAYGIVPTVRMRFFNLGPRLDGARKRLRQIQSAID
jgi:hypothetical protein